MSQVVVFGAGYWGIRYVSELSLNLVAVVEPDKDRADFVHTNYSVPVYSAMPDDLKYDSAVIVTPPSHHVDLAVPILKTGRSVLIEKPLAVSVEEAMKLYAYRKKCMVGHLYLYHPGIEALRTELRTAATTINHIFCRRTNHGPVRPWGDALWDLAPHDISVLNWLFGKPSDVFANGRRDWAMLHIEYPGIDTMTYVSWLGGPKVRTTEIVYNDGHRTIFDDAKQTLEVSPLRLMLNAFLSGTWDRCTLDEGIDVVDVLSKASDSMLPASVQATTLNGQPLY